MDGTVLIADDDRTIRTVLTQALTRAGCRVHATSSLTTLLRWVGEGKGDLVITDVVMPDGNGLEMLPRISDDRPSLPVIVISAQNTIMTAIQATEADAFDYLPKPFDLPDLMKKSARALSQVTRRADDDGDPVIPLETNAPPLVGRSAPMQALYRTIARIMNTDIPVLIRGESGTGKSLVARAIHDLSGRSRQPFVTIDAEAAEDAHTLRDLADSARNGTLLIEEISDFSPQAQALTVRLLDSLPRPAPRVIAVSRADLSALLTGGKLRDDLFFRLGGVELDVPALRERVEDIPLLIEHFRASCAERGLAPRRIGEEAIECARRLFWPGNVRQLEYTIRGLAMSGAGGPVGLAELEARIGGDSRPEISDASDNEKLGAGVERYLRRYFDLHGDELPPPGLYQRILKKVELPLIEIALDATGGNQARCADLLGINRNTLRKKISELDIRVTRRRQLM